MCKQAITKIEEKIILSKKSINDQMLFFVNDSATVKNHSFSAIAEHPGLTCKQIFLLIRKASIKSVSVQAVHKAIKQLESRKVISKNNKKYFINTDWIQQTKSYLELASKKLDETDLETELIIVEIPLDNKNKSISENMIRTNLKHYVAQTLLF